jgi:hypothetical protein
VIVTAVVVGPLVGDIPVMDSASMRVNVTELLASPPTVTTTGPVVVPEGTVNVMAVLLHALVVTVTPLTWSVLEPWLVPKLVPFTVTVPPMGAAGGDKLVMTTGGSAVLELTDTLSKTAVVM